MKVALYGRRIDRPNTPYIVSLVNRLRERGAQIRVFDEYAKLLFPHLDRTDDLGLFEKTAQLDGQTDFFFSIGGDGTMLSSLPLIRDTGIPVVGLNIGRLGFLSSVSKDEIDTALDKLQSGEFLLDKRSMLSVAANQGEVFGDNNFGLNELTVNKTDTSSMITVDVTVNGGFFSRYWADGLIISTATGSTAYNLSCGGPVITPDGRSFAVTAIAPHNLNVRPIIIPDDSVIRLKVHSRSGHYLASVDSNFVNLDASVELTVQKTAFTFNILRLSPHDYLNTLRTKLLWGSDTRNANKFAN